MVSIKLKDPTSEFGFVGGTNPMNNLRDRLNAVVDFSLQSKISDVITQPVTVATVNTDTAIDIPANSLIESIGILYVEDVPMAATSTFNVAVGTSAAGVDLVASTEVGPNNVTILANSFASTSNGNISVVGGAELVMAVAAPLFTGTTSTSIFVSTVVGTAALTTASSFRVVVNYRGL
tara:strand:+ start:55 stop:588 length:534 start_codon:yes stop_codon:yes gene_type:complete